MSDTPRTDAHRTVAKWLNEETDYIPYLEIAEVCAELAEAQAENGRLTRQSDGLEIALHSTLNWLASYPGGGAKWCYANVREALAKIKAGEKP